MSKRYIISFLALLPVFILFFLFQFGVLEKNHQNVDITKGDIKEFIKDNVTASSDVRVKDESFKPFLRKEGKKFRIAVIQSGEYYSYIDVFKSILNGLSYVGWMKDIKLRESPQTMEGVLKELIAQDYSDYLEFSEDLFFDFDWNESNVSDAQLQKIMSQKDQVDLIISLGTVSTKVLATQNNLNIPILGDSISDPVASGIVASNTDSGKEFLTVRCDPETYLRQLRLFHDVVKFKKLGVLYTDTVEGRSYAALEDIKKVSKEKGFEIVPFTKYLVEAEDDPTANVNYLKALKELCPNIDAIYLTSTAGFNLVNLPDIMPIINSYKIPSFAMDGSLYVKNGVLFGVSEDELIAAGIHTARKITSILNGTKPRELPQLFEPMPKISINLMEAKCINYDVPVDVLSSSDEIYK